ncbi:uncharacterized protein BKCO1_6700015 [Diplodia corticola]|uniref:Uncharacterized protein n=1 Tax=Diplodia corticola TaxID=236234 RepID=A0A1J9RC33_9PEZI|nr:uncharacterized protein BKCO1_6700015 [Diplodia corticola]OJD30035.1 hypothetical protein BKCO1_6700015 [Diplodia corticola]
MRISTSRSGLPTVLSLFLACSVLLQGTLARSIDWRLHARAADEIPHNLTIPDNETYLLNGTWLAYSNGTLLTSEDGDNYPVIERPAQARHYIEKVEHNKAAFWSGIDFELSVRIARREGWHTLEMSVTREITSHPWAQSTSPHYEHFWEVVSAAFTESLIDDKHTQVYAILRPPTSLTPGGPFKDGRAVRGSDFGDVEFPRLEKAGITVFAIHPTASDATRASETYEISPKDNVRLWQKSGLSSSGTAETECPNAKNKFMLGCGNSATKEETRLTTCGGISEHEIVLPGGGFCDFSHTGNAGTHKVRFTKSEDVYWLEACEIHEFCP